MMQKEGKAMRVIDQAVYDIVSRLVRVLRFEGCTLAWQESGGEGPAVAIKGVGTAAIDAIVGSGVDGQLLVTMPSGARSWVSLIEVNGADVISDYGVSLDPLIAPVLEQAEWWNNGGRGKRPFPVLRQVFGARK